MKPGDRKRIWGISLIVFAVAFLFRLPFLGHAALWGDEILFVQYMAHADPSPWRVFLEYWQACVDFGQLPLAGVLLSIYMRLTGHFIPDITHHVLALRIPNALAGAGAVVGTYWLGRRLLRPGPNAVATAMATVFFFPVYYSREVYCYPVLMLCAAFAFLFFLKSLFDESASLLTALALFGWSAALGLTHFGCSTTLAAMAAVTATAWILARRRRDSAAARRAAWSTAACVLAGLVVAPYWLRILTSGNPHIASESPVPVLRILNDVVSKFFLGDRPLLAALAWLLWITGLATFWFRKPRSDPARSAVAVVLLTLAVLTILTKKSQYASSRYFAMLAPLAYPVFAQGLWTITHAIARPLRRPCIAPVLFYLLAAATLLVHAGLFLPVLYRVTEKGAPYATTARWLNENAPPGSPYFFDCGGFDQRYIPGYFSTPGLTPAVRIAGNGPGYIEDVRAIQYRLMASFPVSFLIYDPTLPWPEAERFYRNALEYANPYMRRLRLWGIASDVESRNPDAQIRDILYNTRDDAVAMAREADLPLYVDYPGFHCATVVEEVYGRVIAGRHAELSLLNLRDAPLHGSFRLIGAISAPVAESPVQITLPSGETFTAVLPCESMWTLNSPAGLLPAGSSSLRIYISNPAAAKLLLMDVRFVEE